MEVKREWEGEGGGGRGQLYTPRGAFSVSYFIAMTASSMACTLLISSISGLEEEERGEGILRTAPIVPKETAMQTCTVSRQTCRLGGGSGERNASSPY